MTERIINRQVESYIDEALQLSNKFENSPQVTLQLLSRVPPDKKDVGAFDVSVTTAFQCYAPGVAVLKERTDEKSESVAKSTLEAGHHTTRQHVHYTFRLVGVSRSAVHDVFHAHPFYNSEQQSQRYVEAKAGNYLIPKCKTPEQTDLFIQCAEYTNREYFELLTRLHPVVEERIKEMYPQSSWNVTRTRDRLNAKAIKISQEVARYVLPIGQKTNLFHTLSELQLLRLFRASTMPHVTDESRFVIAQMIQSVASVDPTIYKELEESWNNHPERSFDESYIRDQKNEFDNYLGSNQSSLLSFPTDARSILAKSVRNTLGVPESRMNDNEAIKILLDPKENPYLSDVYEIGMLDPITSSLRQINATFISKFSHSGDSQRQRQRMTPGATPSISTLYDGQEDYITPLVIRETEDLNDYYSKVMAKMYENVNKCIEAGVEREHALMLLPNAHAIRVVESGSLYDWLHRWKQRLCYLAQEEIFFVSLEQAQSIKEFLPEAEYSLLAPCGLRQRAGVKPRCPEGERWCGKPVFNFTLDKYAQGRLV